MVWLFVLVGVVLVVALVVLAGFNALRSAEQGVKKDWHNITTELSRRADLIPNLVATVKQYAAHEREVLEQVTEARAAAGRVPADPAQASALERIATARIHGSYAAHARRVRGDLWELSVLAL